MLSGMTRTLRAALVLGAAALTVSALTPAAEATPSPTEVAWEDACPAGSPSGYQCGHLDVPLSYQDPRGAKIRIAVSKLPATEPWHRVGTIFSNPGGPGNPGRFAPVLTPELHKRFDIVGFDPRGIGASTQMHCFTDPSQVAPLARIVGQFPMSPEEEQRHFQDTKAVTDLCEQNAGPLANHLSTATIAQDLDRLREAFGERKLRYYGLSYGTYLAEVYANLFPGRAGSLALDAVDDPVNWTTGYRPSDVQVPMSVRLGAFRDAQHALKSFLSACASDARCAFHEPGVDLVAKYNAILDRLEAGPLTILDPAGAPRRVTYPNAISQVHNGLTDAANSPALAEFLEALTHPVSTPPVPPSGGMPDMATIDSLLAGGATVCSDGANPHDPTVWPGFARMADAQGRGFGSNDTYKTMPCATWKVSDVDRYTGPWNRPTAPVLLISNVQGDPETPYEGAQRTERLLGNARLLSLDTFGHGSRGKSACIDSALDRYFLKGALPSAGTVCKPDAGPFG